MPKNTVPTAKSLERAENMKLPENVRRALNDEAKIAVRDMWLKRLDSLFEGREDEFLKTHVFTQNGRFAFTGVYEAYAEDPEQWMLESMEAFAALGEESSGRFVPDTIEYRPFATHMIDKILGADVFYKDGQWNSRVLRTPVGSLEMPELENNEIVLNIRRAAQAFLDADVRLPLFGMPILSSAFNVYINLYGEEGLCALLEDEDAALHDLTVINDVIRALHRWFVNHIPEAVRQPTMSWQRTQPPGHGQICGCSTHLISGALYRRLIAPLDDAVLAEHPRGGLIHLCGSHTQHIPAFREMKHLKVVQLNDRAAEDVKIYFEGLRKDQIIYLRPCPGMPAEKAVEITGGERLVLQASIDAPLRKA